MEYKIFRFTIFLVSLFLVIYFGFHLFVFLYPSQHTIEIAVPYQFVNKIDLSGIVFREEQIIDKAYQGVIQYNVHNAKKIAKDTPVAVVYPSQKDLLNSVWTSRLNRRIDVLRGVQDQNNADGISNNTGSLVYQKQASVLHDIENQNFSALDEGSMYFLTELLRHQTALNPEVTYDDDIYALTQQRDQLSFIPGDPIKSPLSGYFTSFIDGYETVFNQQALGDMSVDTLANLIHETKPLSTDGKHNIGKVISGSHWKFAALLQTRDVEKLSENQHVSLLFPGNQSSAVQATVEKLYPNDQHEMSTVLLSSDYMNDQIINLRKENPEIWLGEGKGIKVNRNAIRMQDSQIGVYVSVQNTAVFKKLDVIYGGDEFVISRMGMDQDFVQLYDEIMVQTTGLFFE